MLANFSEKIKDGPDSHDSPCITSCDNEKEFKERLKILEEQSKEQQENNKVK